MPSSDWLSKAMGSPNDLFKLCWKACLVGGAVAMEGAHATDEDAPDTEPAGTPSGAREVANSSILLLGLVLGLVGGSCSP